MPRPKGSGLNTVTKRRPDGSVVRYFYDRATGANLGNDRAAAEARVKQGDGDAQLAAEPSPNSLSSIISLYLKSDRFRTRKPKTQALYRGYLEQMRQRWGDLSIKTIRPRDIEVIKQSLAATPSKANMTIAMFRILLKMAVKLEIIRSNPAAEPGRIEQKPRHQIWTTADEDRFLDGARWELQLAMLLMLYTVQRPNDVLAMTIASVTERDGRLWIRLRQAKTDEWVAVPVHRRLEGPLRDRLERKILANSGKGEKVASTLLIPSPRGLLWSYRNFARAWDAQIARSNLRLARSLFAAGLTKERVRAEIAERHRQRRDFRRTGIVRLAEAGATTPQIASLSGHSIDYAQRILDTYLPRRGEVALGGIEAWERAGRQDGNVISLTGRRVEKI